MHTGFFSTFGAKSYAQSALINKIWPKFWSEKLVADFLELSRKFY